MDHCYAVADDNGQIVELNLGPVKVTWSTMGDRVNVRIASGSQAVTIYSSPTGRSLRVFKNTVEMT